MSLFSVNNPLYNTCLRQGLKTPMELLSGCDNEEGRVKTLYRCRVNGFSVIVQRGNIIVNGQLILPTDLDDSDGLMRRVKFLAPGV